MVATFEHAGSKVWKNLEHVLNMAEVAKKKKCYLGIKLTHELIDEAREYICRNVGYEESIRLSDEKVVEKYLNRQIDTQIRV